MYLLSRFDTQANCALSDLPPELLHIILSFLPYDDITTFTLTSKKYLPFLTDQMFWRNKIQSDFPSYYTNYLAPARHQHAYEFHFAQPLKFTPRETYMFLMCFSRPSLGNLDFSRHLKMIGRGSERYLAIDECIYRAVECRDFRLVDYFLSFGGMIIPSTPRLEMSATLALKNGDFHGSLLNRVSDSAILKGLVAGGHLEILQHLICEIPPMADTLGSLIAYRPAFKHGHARLITTFASSSFWTDIDPFNHGSGNATWEQRCCWKRASQGGHEDILSQILTTPISLDGFNSMIYGATIGGQFTIFTKLREHFQGAGHTLTPDDLMRFANSSLMNGHRDFSQRICEELKIPEYTLSLKSAVKGGFPDLVRSILQHQAIQRRDYLDVLNEAFSARQHVEEIVLVLHKAYNARYKTDLMVETDVLSQLKQALKYGDVLMYNLVMDDAYNSSWEWRNGDVLDSRIQCCDLFATVSILKQILKYESPYLLDQYLNAWKRLCPEKKIPRSEVMIMIFDLILQEQLPLLRRLMEEIIPSHAMFWEEVVSLDFQAILESALRDSIYHNRPAIFSWLLDHYGIASPDLALSIAYYIVYNGRETMFTIFMEKVLLDRSHLTLISRELYEKRESLRATEMMRCLSKYQNPPSKLRHRQDTKRKRNDNIEENSVKRMCNR